MLKRILCFLFVITLLLQASIAYCEEFVDIKTHWAEGMIYGLHEKGMVGGEIITLLGGQEVWVFFPDKAITRAEFTKMLVSTFTRDVDAYDNIYADVVADDWYAPYIQSAFKIKLIGSDIKRGEDNFSPDTPISREEMAAMISSAISALRKLPSNPAGDLGGLFNDYAEVADWARNDVQFVKQMQIMEGADNNFNPKAQATRAESCVVLSRYLDMFSNEIAGYEYTDYADFESADNASETHQDSGEARYSLRDFSFLKRGMGMPGIYEKMGKPDLTTESGTRWDIYNLTDGTSIHLRNDMSQNLYDAVLETIDNVRVYIEFEDDGKIRIY